MSQKINQLLIRGKDVSTINDPNDFTYENVRQLSLSCTKQYYMLLMQTY